MEAYVLEWLNLLLRWLHLISGVAWIGASFYFIWLDNHLQAPQDSRDDAKGVGGELWSVHGGGFYHSQKYRVAPASMPERLHWFKWEAYTTWISGMLLLALIYWHGAEVYLLDPSVSALTRGGAIGVAIAYIVGGWVIYDLLCRSRLAQDERLFAAVLLALTALLAWSLCQLFGGRGAYMHFAAVLGTIMVANVAMVIIPGQRQMVAAAERGEAPDPAPGIRAKQRSVHNTYFTLPVLFVMISNHYASTYGHAYNWAILVAISLVGALIRVYFVARHKGRASPLPAVLALLLLAGLAVAIAPQPRATNATAASFEQVRHVINARCANCHAEVPVHPGFPAAPLGVMLDTDERILTQAARIHQQTVVARVMPIGNLTAITEEERQIIDRWYRAMVEP